MRIGCGLSVSSPRSVPIDPLLTDPGMLTYVDLTRPDLVTLTGDNITGITPVMGDATWDNGNGTAPPYNADIYGTGLGGCLFSATTQTLLATLAAHSGTTATLGIQAVLPESMPSAVNHVAVVNANARFLIDGRGVVDPSPTRLVWSKPSWTGLHEIGSARILNLIAVQDSLSQVRAYWNDKESKQIFDPDGNGLLTTNLFGLGDANVAGSSAPVGFGYMRMWFSSSAYDEDYVGRILDRMSVSVP